MNKSIKLLSAFFLLGIASAPAQELKESLEVEGTYIKDIIDPERIVKLPRQMMVSPGEVPMRYEDNAVRADFSPSSPALSATPWGAQREVSPYKGYVDLEMGSWLNSSLYAGYDIIRHPQEILGVRLEHNSTSLWRPLGSGFPARFRYDEGLGADYTRLFSGKGLLNASAHYRLGYFNYYGLLPGDDGDEDAGGGDFRYPTQTLNDVSAMIGWRSLPGRHEWSLNAGVRYFGYRTATRETDLSLRGGYSGGINGASRAGFDVRGNLFLYGSHEGMAAPDNFGAVALTPYYEYRRRGLYLRLGADMDLTFNASGSRLGEHYDVFRIAPDVRFEVSGKRISFYIHALGGNEMHTLASTSQYDPYRNPRLESTSPVYTPLDANIGMTATPFAGFEARLNLRYNISRDVPMGGWYSVLMNYGRECCPGLRLPAGATPLYGESLRRYDLSGFGVGLYLGYSPSEVFRISGEGSYVPQRLESGIFNGLDRPRWVLEARAEAKPLRQLSLTLGYEYRGVRNITTQYSVAPEAWSRGGGSTIIPGTGGGDAERKEGGGYARLRLPDITRLWFGAHWDFSKRFSLGFKADNLLNQKSLYLPCLPGEGITFSGVLSYKF